MVEDGLENAGGTLILHTTHVSWTCFGESRQHTLAGFMCVHVDGLSWEREGTLSSVQMKMLDRIVGFGSVQLDKFVLCG